MRTVLVLFAITLLCTILGCKKSTYVVKCNDSIKSLGITDSTFSVKCPTNCNSGIVWGTDIYTTDSSICMAAIHAGVLNKDGGTIKITIKPGENSYTGSKKNGVKSSGWGSFDKSFTVSK